MNKHSIKKAVREGYAKVAQSGFFCCGPKSSCNTDTAQKISKNIGYSETDIHSVPDGSNLGLGCGNPVAFASLKEGQTVLDLGSGAGFDCFLAAKRVGSNGKVIGVDMTPEMLERARDNAEAGQCKNVEFRLGEIEHLPVADRSVDVIISNCVINLSPDKAQVFREAFRVLKPGGRLMVSDIVLEKNLPKSIKDSIEAYIGCLSGALLKSDYIDLIKASGFQNVEIIQESFFSVDDMDNDVTAKAVLDKLSNKKSEMNQLSESVASIKVSAFKPNRGTYDAKN